MSGGVDSSVAAALLVEQGHDVTGVTLKLWGGESDSGCCSVADVEDARRVAAQLDIPHYVFNFTDEFDAAVVDPYVEAYAHGSTPNPCVECNRAIKFGRLFERADALGFDTVATGHHARVEAAADGRLRLRRGADRAKDQSYVISMLGQRELARTMLPVGELTKAEVREHASRLGLRTAAKAESMDVCFITRGGREQFLESRLGARPDSSSTPRVRSSAVTAASRRSRSASGAAWGWPSGSDATSSTSTLHRQPSPSGPAAISPATRCSSARSRSSIARSRSGARVQVQTRAHGEPVDATVIDRDTVVFASPQSRVAPGQVVAFYDGEYCLGGGLAR